MQDASAPEAIINIKTETTPLADLEKIWYHTP
jgi:hypothetical protein